MPSEREVVPNLVNSSIAHSQRLSMVRYTTNTATGMTDKERKYIRIRKCGIVDKNTLFFQFYKLYYTNILPIIMTIFSIPANINSFNLFLYIGGLIDNFFF